MFHAFGTCSEHVQGVGLAHRFDGDDVLVCRVHLPALRGMSHREAELLRRYLRRTFGIAA
jgi:hypothetical protein